MDGNTVLFQLDYGGLTDSRNRKVNVYSATGVAKGRKLEHFDFLFDSANQCQREGERGAKKDGQSGIYFLDMILDPSRNPAANGKSILHTYYPTCKRIILSGDTGNGFRGYEMLDYLSTVHEKYKVRVELIPLAPGQFVSLLNFERI